MFCIENIEVFIENIVYQELLSYEQNHKNDSENGGVILGKMFPDENKILITHIISSVMYSSKYEVQLNIEILQEKIKDIWKNNKEITYLGDWHTHPQIDPDPSITDLKTFINNYKNSKFVQNLLIYIILGRKNSIFSVSYNGAKFNKLNIKILE